MRPTAGASVCAASVSTITEIKPVLAIIAGILVAGGVHTVKSVAVRPAVTAATAGAGNVPVSFLEDVVSTAVSVLAVAIPAIVVVVIILGVAFIIDRQMVVRNVMIHSRLVAPVW